ncbi:MAG: CAAX prenyl protease-related protein [Usitatibacter sp.]
MPPSSRPVLARVAPFALFVALMAAQPWLERMGADGRWLAVLRAGAAGALLVFFRRDYGELRKPPAATPAREWAIAVAVGIGVFAAWIHLDRPGIALDAGPGFDPGRKGGGIDWPLAMARLCSLALVVPVMEELFWRSFVMRRIAANDFLASDPRRVGAVPIVISSALFASEHALWLAGLLAGLAYAWLYRRTANLRIPIVSHAVTNGTLGIWILATGSWRFW